MGQKKKQQREREAGDGRERDQTCRARAGSGAGGLQAERTGERRARPGTGRRAQSPPPGKLRGKKSTFFTFLLLQRRGVGREERLGVCTGLPGAQPSLQPHRPGGRTAQ